MRGNILTGKRIDNQDIVVPPCSLHERQSIIYMTCDIPWQATIPLRQRERDWIDFNNGNPPACSRQHGAKSAAAAADHEDAFPGPLLRYSTLCMSRARQPD